MGRPPEGSYVLSRNGEGKGLREVRVPVALYDECLPVEGDMDERVYVRRAGRDASVAGGRHPRSSDRPSRSPLPRQPSSLRDFGLEEVRTLDDHLVASLVMSAAKTIQPWGRPLSPTFLPPRPRSKDRNGRGGWDRQRPCGADHEGHAAPIERRGVLRSLAWAWDHAGSGNASLSAGQRGRVQIPGSHFFLVAYACCTPLHVVLGVPGTYRILGRKRPVQHA
jgi:hypothetical protein